MTVDRPYPRIERIGLHVDPQHLDQRLGHRCGADVHRRQQSRSEIRTVRRKVDVVRLALGEDAHHLADATDLGHARLCDVNRAGLDQGTEAVQPSHVLPGGNRHTTLADKGEAVAVLRRPYGLLEPEQIVMPQRLRHRAGAFHRPWAIHVEHDLCRRPPSGSLCCGLRGKHRLPGQLVQFYVPIALGAGGGGVASDEIIGAVAQQAGIRRQWTRITGAAEQPMQWLSGALACDVPQRDLYTGVGVDEGAVATQQVNGLQDVGRQRGDVAGIATQREWGDDAIEGNLGRSESPRARRPPPSRRGRPPFRPGPAGYRGWSTARRRTRRAGRPSRKEARPRSSRSQQLSCPTHLPRQRLEATTIDE